MSAWGKARGSCGVCPPTGPKAGKPAEGVAPAICEKSLKDAFEPSPEIRASDREFPLSERRRLLCNGPQIYKLDNLVFTNVTTAIDRNPGVCCDKGRRVMAPRASLYDPWRPRPNQSR